MRGGGSRSDDAGHRRLLRERQLGAGSPCKQYLRDHGPEHFPRPWVPELGFLAIQGFQDSERFAAQFRVEFFNVTNHPNLANPYGGAVNSALGNDPSVTGGFGCGCATPDIVNGNPILGSGDAREMQLGFKFSF